MTQFCAYVHARPTTKDASGIFYVGKGNVRRAQNLHQRNPHHANVVEKYGAKNILVGTMACSSEDIAFDLEKGLIKCLRRMGVTLTNRTDGGEGISGLVHSASTKRKIAAAGMGRKFSDEHKRKIGDVWRGRKHSIEAVEKIRLSKLGNSIRKGKTQSVEARDKLRAANLGKKASTETVEKLKKFWTGRIHVNNGITALRVLPNEIPEGFVRGRLPSFGRGNLTRSSEFTDPVNIDTVEQTSTI
jgi:hypothetical protein